MMKTLRGKGGFVLIGVIFILVLGMLMAVNGTAMFMNQTRTSMNDRLAVEDHALELGATKLVLRGFRSYSPWLNWGSESMYSSPQTYFFGRGAFSITFQKLTGEATGNPRRLNVLIASVMSSFQLLDELQNQITSKVYEFAVWKQPKALLFGLFLANASGDESVNITGVSTIKGSLYNRGNLDVGDNSVVHGKVYVPTGSSVSGTGVVTVTLEEGDETVTIERFANPAPETLPVLNLSAQEAEMDEMDGLIDTNIIAGVCDNSQPLLINADLDVANFSNPQNYCDIYIDPASGDPDQAILITGTGDIIAQGEILIRTISGSVNVNPVGGNIRFISQKQVRVVSDFNNFPTDIQYNDPYRVILYSRQDLDQATPVWVASELRGNQVTAVGARIYARRDFAIRDAHVSSQTADKYTDIYVPTAVPSVGGGGSVYITTDTVNPGNAQNDARFHGTVVSTYFKMADEADVQGIIYASEGARLQRGTVRGVIMAGGLTFPPDDPGNPATVYPIEDLNLTYDQSILPGVLTGESMLEIFDLNDPQVLPWMVPNTWKQLDNDSNTLS